MGAEGGTRIPTRVPRSHCLRILPDIRVYLNVIKEKNRKKTASGNSGSGYLSHAVLIAEGGI